MRPGGGLQKECRLRLELALSSWFMTPWAVAGFVLIGLGLERLVNVGLLGGEPTSYPVRLLFAVAATGVGGLLLVLARRPSSR
ncbi:MAG: hypothetical protein ACREK6_10155 [Candidatus Rokuibacteriota bacterium]